MNMRQKMELRSKANTAIRAFFADQNYLEAETPRFVSSPDIEPTLTHLATTVRDHKGRQFSGALITSPEYSLKKIVSPEAPRIFELARVFRNDEPLDALHNPEFTMLEWYRLGATFQEGIQETIELFNAVATAVNGRRSVMFSGREIPLQPSAWRMATCEELFREHAGIESLAQPSRELYQEALQRYGHDWQESDTIGDLFQRVFLNRVQPFLDTADVPVVVTQYPHHEATLARLNAQGFAERFEVYIGGVELCNGYGELTDPVEQRRRFVEEQRERTRLGKALFPIDEELISALQRIHEPLFGNAVGIDRLLMIVAGLTSLDDVLLFSTRRLFGPPDT